MSPVRSRHCFDPSLLVLLSFLLAGCATAFEYPSQGAWGQIVEEKPGHPVLYWNFKTSCVSARLGPCRPMSGPNGGQTWVLSHWDQPSRSIYLWTSREACESPKWASNVKRECRQMSIEPGR